MIEIPFHSSYQSNQERITGSAYPCLVCGKAVTRPNPKMCRMWSGTALVTDAEAELLNDPASDMGYYPIGADCLRKHPELKSYVSKSQPNE